MVLGEFTGVNHGLGATLLQARETLNPDIVIALMIIIGLLWGPERLADAADNAESFSNGRKMNELTSGYRLGVDIGGTFTDFVLEEVATGKLHLGKTLTTPIDPSDAVINGLRSLLETTGIAASDIGLVVHGTTLGTNAVIERTGARPACSRQQASLTF